MPVPRRRDRRAHTCSPTCPDRLPARAVVARQISSRPFAGEQPPFVSLAQAGGPRTPVDRYYSLSYSDDYRLVNEMLRYVGDRTGLKDRLRSTLELQRKAHFANPVPGV